MRKNILCIIGVIMLMLSGCSNNETQYSKNDNVNDSAQVIDGIYTGLWEHTEYPDSYSIVISEENDDGIDFEVSAIRGNAAQIATARMTNVKLVDGKGNFNFIDSFNNSGSGAITINGSQLTITYNTDEPYQGNWCVDAGEGTYTKTKELSEINSAGANTIVENDRETIDLEQFGVVDKWMYRVMEYTKSGEDIYDDDIDFYISDAEITEQKRGNGSAAEKTYLMTENGYDSTSSVKDGYIKAYPSDRSGYDAKLIMKRFDESQSTLYLKVVVPGCVFEIIYENGDEYGTYETWDYAHRNYNTESYGYKRDDYEYKEYHNKPTGWVPDEYKE